MSMTGYSQISISKFTNRNSLRPLLYWEAGPEPLTRKR
ncbi:uncharacterized protein METZ01_LOCUS235944 [marine metagenome]|uniref:Uncharacterized protein n=1 Tax=marine metagenome TaxID=408172 RepID=A0A382H746_9ZZZZ